MSWKVKENNGSIVCSLVEKKVVLLEYRVKKKIELLMAEYTNQEWFGYLTGSMEEDKILVEDLFIPPHKEVSGASCEIEPFYIPDNCVGVIHSHHTMGAFHSGTDSDHVDKNYPVSITVAKRHNSPMEFSVVTFAMTPCGKSSIGKADLLFVEPDPLFNTKDFLKKAKRNIEKGQRKVQVRYGHYSQVGEGFPNNIFGRSMEEIYRDYGLL